MLPECQQFPINKVARVNYGKLNELELKSGSVNSQVA